MKVSLDVVKANEYNYLLASTQSNRLYPPAIYFMTPELKASLKSPKDRKETKKNEVSDHVVTKVKLKIPFDPQDPDKTFSQEVPVFKDGHPEDWCKWHMTFDNLVQM